MKLAQNRCIFLVSPIKVSHTWTWSPSNIQVSWFLGVLTNDFQNGGGSPEMNRVFRDIPQEACSLPSEWTEQHVAAQLLPRYLGKMFDFLGTDLKIILGDCSLKVFLLVMVERLNFNKSKIQLNF